MLEEESRKEQRERERNKIERKRVTNGERKQQQKDGNLKRKIKNKMADRKRQTDSDEICVQKSFHTNSSLGTFFLNGIRFYCGISLHQH